MDIPPENIAGLELLDKEFHKDLISDKTGVLDVKLRLKNNTIIVAFNKLLDDIYDM